MTAEEMQAQVRAVVRYGVANGKSLDEIHEALNRLFWKYPDAAAELPESMLISLDVD